MYRKAFSLAAAAAALMLALALASAVGAAEGKGVLKGSLVNVTSGGSSVADQEVTLTAYKANAESGKQTVRADREGKFTFEGLETTPDVTYQAVVQFQDAPYFSEPVTFSATAAEKSVQIQMADSTSSEESVKMAATHYLVQPSSSGLNVSEIVVIRNSSDRTFVGSKESHPGVKETVRFALPAEAQEVEMGTGFLPGRAFPLESGISDGTPLYPGDSQRIFRYRVPASGDSAGFTTKVAMATDRIQVLMPDTGARLSVTNLPTRSNPDMQGDKYVMLGGQNLVAGTELQFKVEGLSTVRAPAAPLAAPAAAPAAAAPRPSSMLLPFVAAGTALVVALVVVAVVVRRQRRNRDQELAEDEEADLSDPSDPSDASDESEADLEAERQELIASIARLDDAFETGQLGSQEYGRLRAERKERLVEVAGHQKALAAARSEQ